MKKIVIILIYTLLITLLLIHKDSFLTWIRSGDELSILISILFFALLVFFPAVPFLVAAGIMGASYGVAAGSGIVLTGVMIGTIAMFLLARYGFQVWTQKILSKYERVKHYEYIFENNAFIAILGLRVFPIIPTPLANVLCGVTRVNTFIYIAASALGKLPKIIIFTVVGYQATDSMFNSIIIYIIYFLILSIVVGRKFKQDNSGLHV
ncbi:TVP38/TMEM64 family protein [Salinibacillus xinjiangensis]|uniref:TVP38/TMEM64 family membrane protein n=1 Tax=Salinibacillus xinjiangensis TaxID=1229268 RepID=A0A6G1X213_9BACI|nr:TVP38/TMEM64 family protein [Salinibacillus xinjiangensis]MRG85023.1 TVP38/TMEM64 family protein [Salinibacillus xinjiangensis]